MNKVKQKLFLGVLVPFLICSCNKSLLTQDPQTYVASSATFSSSARIANQVLGLYSALKDGNFYGGRIVIYGDIRADQFINLKSNVVTGYDVWSENPTDASANSIISLWKTAYATINDANLFLDGIKSVSTTILDTTTAKNYIGEAKFIRALSYFSLLQYYARPYADGTGTKPAIPLRLTGIVGAGSSNLAKSTTAAVYQQIIKDLDSAELLLPTTYSTAYNNTTRAHKNSAIALKTRVYLAMQNYPMVITEANKIVSPSAPFTASTGVVHALQANIANVFKAPYTTTESILSMPMTSTTGDNPGTQNQLGYYFDPSPTGNGEYKLNTAAGSVYADNTWKSTDARRTNFITVSSGSYYLTKYPTGNPYTDYVPVIRYSEVLLNLAEALARTNTSGVDTRALALVNAVRQRSDATTTIAAADQASLINAILNERNIEFLGEGLRIFDILRLLQTIPAKGVISSVSPSQSGYIWPISADEKSLNSLLGGDN